MDILIIYGSLEGQTKKISEHMADILQTNGHQTTTLSSEHLPTDFQVEDYDAAIVGGSIHINKYPKPMIKFVTRHRDWLNATPSAFFTVCMGINSKRPESQQQALQFGQNFLSQTGWKPMLNETFAGAVKYTQYGFITRYIMKRISKHEGGSTDTTRDHEYTDWDRVAHFAEKFAAMVTAQEKSKSAEAEMD
ncbi:hypothetical protein Tel_09215 [Candidatus Tenderia electrophaga]|jgi:menaquinone-dependent protoporphyrinogen oxidase|uniref:Flavodoxin domain-containing protein n=1 Tax=Candidatus Tenderia electrophaga TaxID=1748243 RepID=A0A0S2TDT2_9GAMM|nr:hypothetical protein Tel_09215 [Candidatus Tenderia electrophaga]